MTSRKYLRGLLAPVERKNGWQLAEVGGDERPDATQRLLSLAQWEADASRDRLQQLVIEVFGDAEGIGVVDETGFIKKADHRKSPVLVTCMTTLFCGATLHPTHVRLFFSIQKPPVTEVWFAPSVYNRRFRLSRHSHIPGCLMLIGYN